MTDTKICTECSREFNQNKNKVCSRCRHRARRKQGIVEKPARMRLNLIDFYAAQCHVCFYDKCLEALEFHHLDPIKKLFNLSVKDLSGCSWEKALEEVEKCILLCANCHREHHAGVLGINLIELKMTRKEFIDAAVEKLGDLNFPRLGKLISKYKLEFLYRCLEKFPVEKIEKLDSGAKIGYLQKICQGEYTAQDLNHRNKLEI